MAEPDVQEQRLRFLAESLAAMRVAEKADVTMVCGEKEFYAHKLVLEASSPYFTTMFRSNLEEAKSGKVVFKDMEPETLDAVLDFIYLGDVKKMKSGDQLRKVLEASHMMELHDLFQYCCTSLLQMLSPETILEIWMLAENYESERMLAEVKSYFLANSIPILTSNNFLNATVIQLKDMVGFFKFKFRNMDRMLKAIVLWVLHDLPAREQLISELFTYVEANRVSKKCVKSLLDDSEVTTISTKLDNRLNKLVVEMYFMEEMEAVEEEEQVETPESEKTHLKTCGCKLFYFTQQRTTLFDEYSELTEQSESCIQQFDLDTMTWQPPLSAPFMYQFNVDAMCQWRDCIFLVGSTVGNFYVLYDVKKNTVQYVKTENNVSHPDSSAISFNNSIFLIGGCYGFGIKSSEAFYLENRSWQATQPLKLRRNKPVLYISERFLCVTGDTSPDSSHFIEYTDGKRVNVGNSRIPEWKLVWHIVELPTNFVSADIQFFRSNNRWCGVYNSRDAQWKLTNINGNWNVQKFPINPHHSELKANSISHFPTPKKSFLFNFDSGQLLWHSELHSGTRVSRMDQAIPAKRGV